MTRSTLRSVAEAAGVSAATVSLVLRDKPHAIPTSTVDRVRRAAAEQGYRPNRAAQAMRTGRTGLVLLSLRMMTDPWALAVADTIGEAAEGSGATALVQSRGDWFDTVLRLQPDVAYLDSPTPGAETARRLAELVARGQRLVVFSDTLAADGFDVIRSDAAPGTALVLDAILPHTGDVAYLRPTVGGAVHPSQAARHDAYAAAVTAGRVERDRTTDYDGSRTSAFGAALRLLSSPGRPAAILGNTDYAALAALQAAQYLGLRVPDDVMVAGLGNTAEAAQAAPALTTAGPEDFFARQAAIVLDAASRDAGTGTLHTFPWRLYPRRSTFHHRTEPRIERNHLP
ncbi:LacI family transcriptional regulator [Propioniciclava coleopterorum]|uniref:LacI family transcriptional regulator n=1 Tax=Propioniciclava coleopterorum TaxID=2714937 RepID=A0A6G7Y4C1_9ACTN|nr:LacI family DNA-binding transcriptional regulator [Propioniciclava coleopterorum]QIK71633.1 LacI family transcriptional regulator [Propioniciclava coleopterorum]